MTNSFYVRMMSDAQHRDLYPMERGTIDGFRFILNETMPRNRIIAKARTMTAGQINLVTALLAGDYVDQHQVGAAQLREQVRLQTRSLRRIHWDMLDEQSIVPRSTWWLACMGELDRDPYMPPRTAGARAVLQAWPA